MDDQVHVNDVFEVHQCPPRLHWASEVMCGRGLSNVSGEATKPHVIAAVISLGQESSSAAAAAAGLSDVIIVSESLPSKGTAGSACPAESFALAVFRIVLRMPSL